MAGVPTVKKLLQIENAAQAFRDDKKLWRYIARAREGIEGAFRVLILDHRYYDWHEALHFIKKARKRLRKLKKWSR